MSKLPWVLTAAFAIVAGFVMMGRSSMPDAPAPNAAAPMTPAVPTLASTTPEPATVLASSIGSEVITVYKSPSCGCCGDWIAHLEENGFAVEVVDESAMGVVKQRLGVPGAMHSCHTAVIDGEIVEGHVPADVLRDYLADEAVRSASLGLAVPGMPVGSPGMEIEGQPADAYDVIAFGTESEKVYASR